MSNSPTLTSRIAILGAGEVGSTIAYSLILNPVASEILLVDPKEDVRDAQVQDLSDASHQDGASTTRVRAGTHQEAGQCDVVVVTAGAKQKKGESRTDLIGRNKAILESSIASMKPLHPSTVLLIVVNPVDVLTYFAQKLSRLPPTQVFGSGTVLDSARLRGLLAAKCGIAAASIDAFVLGEHGESQVVAWSRVAIGGVPLAKATPRDARVERGAVEAEVRDKAAGIIAAKGSTSFGVGGVVGAVCKAVLYNTCAVLPVSYLQEGEGMRGVCLSMPVVLGRRGIVKKVEMPLGESEETALRKSAENLRKVIDEAEEADEADSK